MLLPYISEKKTKIGVLLLISNELVNVQVYRLLKNVQEKDLFIRGNDNLKDKKIAKLLKMC